MPDARVISHAARGWRLAAGLVVVTVAVAAQQGWQTERRSAALRDEVAGLRSRLADRRELIAHQRHEMAQVASAVDHLARTTGALGERGAEARRLAHMEESRAETRALVNVAATLDGGVVIVAHGGQLDTLYGHLSAFYVREGQSVRRGQAIGAVGATGRATGAHLHYEVRVNGAPVDPRRYLAK